MLIFNTNSKIQIIGVKQEDVKDTSALINRSIDLSFAQNYQ